MALQDPFFRHLAHSAPGRLMPVFRLAAGRGLPKPAACFASCIRHQQWRRQHEQQQQWSPAALPTTASSSSRASESSSSSSRGSPLALWRQQQRQGAAGQRPPAATASGLGGSGELSLDGGEPSVDSPELRRAVQSRAASLLAGLDAAYRFTRPHTLLGTFISVCSISLLALGPGDFGGPALKAFLQALVSALLMNVSIVGINQIYDIEIDRINKPYLPLAAGLFSVRTAIAIVTLTAIASLAIGAWSSSAPLLATLGGSLALGIAYSTDLPFLRWKRWPLVAAGCILAVRAVLVQLGFYLHMRQALGAGGGLGAVTPTVMFATAFMLAFSIVIALFKDIPDVAGDCKAGLRTLSVRLGTQRVFWICIGILEAAYCVAAVVGLFGTHASVWGRAGAGGAHIVMGVVLLWRARQTDLSSSKSIYDAYMFVWKLFYLEYLLLPLLR